MSDGQKIASTIATLANAIERMESIDFGNTAESSMHARAQLKTYQQQALQAATTIAAGLLTDINRIAYALEKLASQSGNQLFPSQQ